MATGGGDGAVGGGDGAVGGNGVVFTMSCGVSEVRGDLAVR